MPRKITTENTQAIIKRKKHKDSNKHPKDFVFDPAKVSRGRKKLASGVEVGGLQGLWKLEGVEVGLSEIGRS